MRLLRITKNKMPFKTADLRKAMISLEQFKTYTLSPHHERYSFPFIRGTYFAYRKIDVLRIISISKIVAKNGKSRYLDVGCGNGDFLTKIRELFPMQWVLITTQKSFIITTWLNLIISRSLMRGGELMVNSILSSLVGWILAWISEMQSLRKRM